jgi:ATP-dependent helicase/nuclease subunit A
MLRVDRFGPVAPTVAEPEPLAEPGQLVLFEANGAEPLPPAAPTLPPLVPVPEPPLHRVRRLSYSALALFESCSYRYYAERIVGMRPGHASGSVPGHEGLAATEIGDSVHFLLEELDLEDPRPPEPSAMAMAVRSRYPAVTDEELERIAGLVRAYCESEVAARIATLGGAATERPFAFEHDGVLLHGRLDVFHREGSTAVVVDYKTNVLEDASPEEVIERDYRLQRLVYALACFRDGAETVEVVYQFLEQPDQAVATTFDRSELPALETELSQAIERIQQGIFEPTPSEFVCAGCPVLDVVCAGPRLREHPESSIPAEIAVG